jgi:hypothetical protein
MVGRRVGGGTGVMDASTLKVGVLPADICAFLGAMACATDGILNQANNPTTNRQAAILAIQIPAIRLLKRFFFM